jgi:hypothetical protein
MAAVTHGPADDGATLMPYQYFCLINIFGTWNIY